MVTAYRPGVSVTSRATPPPRGLSVDSGVWFVIGAAQKGPVDKPLQIRNMTEFLTYYGSRQSYSLLWDSLETFFREGGTRAYVSRAVGSSAGSAGLTLNDAAGTPGTSLRVSAANPGAWGNSLSVAVVASVTSGEYHLVVSLSGTVVETSISLADQAAAVNWSQRSDYVRVTIPGGAGTLDPAVLSATALTGGIDDNSGITDSDRLAALARIHRGYGIGQVSAPGNTASAVRTGLINHARLHNRTALLDTTDTATRSSLVTEGTGLQGDEYGALFAPWLKIPGVVAGTTRTVPPVALAAGLMARNDPIRGVNEPAAGDYGRARYVLDVNATWSDADRELLNEAGVNVINAEPTQIALYGYRTLAKPTVDKSWLGLNNQRLRMEIVARAELLAKTFLFNQIDGEGRKVAQFGGALSGMLLEYYNRRSLFGITPTDAFFVDVGESVNTPDTLEDKQLNAVISLRMSPYAELVTIEIAKTPVNQAL